jgi:hypothetical protein
LPFLGLGEVINRLKKRPKLIDQLENDYGLDKAEVELDLKKAA